MTEGEYLAHVKELAQRLVNLIDDKQPGLLSWCMMYGKTFQELSDLWVNGASARTLQNPANAKTG